MALSIIYNSNCVNITFSLRDLPPYFSDQSARVERIEVNYGGRTSAAGAVDAGGTIICFTGD